MEVEQFITRKAPQLAYYLRAFWARRIPYAEVDLYFWDTMEEWTQINACSHEPSSQKERVFWHLLHQLHFWDEKKLLEDPYLHSELEVCVDFLEGASQVPFDCVGVRP